MIVENPLALSYILPADVFFLNTDRQAMADMQPVTTENATEIRVEEPVVAYQAPEPITTAPIIPKVVEQPTVAAPAIPKIEIRPAPVAQVPAMPVTATPTVATTPNFAYLGDFAQKFLVIVSYPNQDVMEAGHLKALESTITRKEMSMGDVAIFNIGKYPGTDLKAIARFFKPKRMLLLGRDSFPIGLADQPLNQLTLLGTCQLLYSDSFTDMMGNKEKTKAFWEQMKML